MKAVVFLCLVAVFVGFASAICENNCNSPNGRCVGGICECHGNYAGSDCSYIYAALDGKGAVQTGSVPTFGWAFYYMNIDQAGTELVFNINQTSTDGDCDIYINRLNFPTRTNWIRRDISTKKEVSITLGTSDTTVAGKYIAGIYGFISCQYSISGVNKGLVSCPKQCSGHGVCGPTGICSCSAGWSGDACDTSDALNPNSAPINDSVGQREWKFYPTVITEVPTVLFYNMTLTTLGDADLYIGFNNPPTVATFIASNTTMDKVSTVTVQVTQAGTYYAGVLGFWAGSNPDGKIGYTIYVKAERQVNCQNTTRCSEHGTCMSSGCQCTSDYQGKNCEERKNALTLGQTVTGFVADSIWNYYRYQGVDNKEVTVSLRQVGSGDCDLYIKGGANPTTTSYDYAELGTMTTFNATIPEPLGTTWYIGIFGWSSCSYSLTVGNRDTKDCVNGTWDPSIDGCICNPGWTGDKCDQRTNQLVNGAVVNGTIAFNNWVYYTIVLQRTHSLEVRMRELNSTIAGSVWLYVSRDGFPTLHTYDKADSSTNDKLHSVYLASQGAAWSGPVYIGVYGSPYGKETDVLKYSLVAWYPDFR